MKASPSSYIDLFCLPRDRGGAGEGELHARPTEDAGECRASQGATLDQLGRSKGAHVADCDRLVEDDVLAWNERRVVCDTVFRNEFVGAATARNHRGELRVPR